MSKLPLALCRAEIKLRNVWFIPLLKNCISVIGPQEQSPDLVQGYTTKNRLLPQQQCVLWKQSIVISLLWSCLRQGLVALGYCGLQRLSNSCHRNMATLTVVSCTTLSAGSSSVSFTLLRLASEIPSFHAPTREINLNNHPLDLIHSKVHILGIDSTFPWQCIINQLSSSVIVLHTYYNNTTIQYTFYTCLCTSL